MSGEMRENLGPPTPEALWEGFDLAFRRFLKREAQSIRNDVSERNLCAHLAHELISELNRPGWGGYYADTEYNRKQGGQVKTLMDDQLQIMSITCDLIVHSRGEIPGKDNLIAVEMKKTVHSAQAKDSDRRRLIALTRSSYDGVWSADGKTLPEHVCGYEVGLLIELDNRSGEAGVEEYRRGELVRTHTFHF
ncbi:MULTISPECIES: hypothetical protein [unclassified Brevundimonas]|uniref:hypothetical protein n=1 Tax=unclassified Brevundimonas TaxID=2622653 RepID=UPI0018EA3438|nr:MULTISPECIES: hypothetical protein [unclassified Brevundimonas]